MIPNPVMRKPGSMPRILRAGPAIAPHYSPLLIDHRRGVDLLHVVDVLQRLEQLLHPPRLIAFQNVFRGGLHGDFREVRLQPGFCEPVSHRDEIGGRANHFHRAVVVGGDVLGAGVERRFHDFFLARPGRENELAAVLEEERDRPVGAEIASVLGEGVAHLRHGSDAVVAQAVHHHRRPARPVALVAGLLVADALQAARAALRRALDRVLGHVRVVRLVDRKAQPRVHRRIGPAQARGHRDLLDQPREDLALLGVRRRFLVLYVGPSGMSCHGGAARPRFWCGRAYNFIIHPSRQANPNPFSEQILDLKIRGKAALVCGASKGLGRGCATSLAREGCRVTLVARERQTLEKAADEIRAATGATVITVAADITSEQGRIAALAACPQPDILVTNAGGPPPGDFRKFSREDWLKAVGANMLTPIELIKATVDGMMAKRFGRIVNITSSAVKAPIAELALSNGARSGLTGFVAGLARKTVAHNVTINNLLPGRFWTDRLISNTEFAAKEQGRTPEEIKREREKEIPAGRFGTPEEFGELCAYLCSVQAGYITGQNFLIDGGIYPGTF